MINTMSTLSELCRDAICGIRDKEGIYTEEKLLIALDHIIRSDDMNSSEIKRSLIQA